MNRHDILQKAVERAVHNGYLNDENQIVSKVTVGSLKKGSIKIHIDFKINKESQYWQTQSSDCRLDLYAIVFDHRFAKAFFKDEEWDFIHYLKEMVAEEDPIKYLGQFLAK